MKTKFFFTFFAISFLLACSKQDSENIDISFSPENPVVKFVDGKVITGTDLSTNLPTYEDIKAPWFKFTAVVQNGSNKNLIVESLTLKMMGLTTTQGFVTVESVLTAESYVGPQVPAPEVLATVTAGTSSATTFEFYVSGLSEAVTSGVYTVEVHAEGWFGSVDDPTSLFSQKYFFTTR